MVNAMEKNPKETRGCNFKQSGQKVFSGKIIFKHKNWITNCISHSVWNALPPNLYGNLYPTFST